MVNPLAAFWNFAIVKKRNPAEKLGFVFKFGKTFLIMKRKFLVFRKTDGGTVDGGPLPQPENEIGGGGNAETSGANEQADASRGEPAPQFEKGQKLASGQPAPDYYQKAHQNDKPTSEQK